MASSSSGRRQTASDIRRGKPGRLPEATNADLGTIIQGYKDMTIKNRTAPGEKLARVGPLRYMSKEKKAAATGGAAARSSSSNSRNAASTSAAASSSAPLVQLLPEIKAADLVLQHGRIFDYYNPTGDILTATVWQQYQIEKVRRIEELLAKTRTSGTTNPAFVARVASQCTCIELATMNPSHVKNEVAILRRAIPAAANTQATILQALANHTKCNVRVWSTTATGHILVSPKIALLVRANLVAAPTTLNYLYEESARQPRYLSLIPSKYATEYEREYQATASPPSPDQPPVLVSPLRSQPRGNPASAAALERLRGHRDTGVTSAGSRDRSREEKKKKSTGSDKSREDLAILTANLQREAMVAREQAAIAAAQALTDERAFDGDEQYDDGEESDEDAAADELPATSSIDGNPTIDDAVATVDDEAKTESSRAANRDINASMSSSTDSHHGGAAVEAKESKSSLSSSSSSGITRGAATSQSSRAATAAASSGDSKRTGASSQGGTDGYNSEGKQLEDKKVKASNNDDATRREVMDTVVQFEDDLERATRESAAAEMGIASHRGSGADTAAAAAASNGGHVHDDDESGARGVGEHNDSKTDDGWRCIECTFDHDVNVPTCDICGATRTVVALTWPCATCTYQNDGASIKCAICSADKLITSSVGSTSLSSNIREQKKKPLMSTDITSSKKSDSGHGTTDIDEALTPPTPPPREDIQSAFKVDLNREANWRQTMPAAQCTVSAYEAIVARAKQFDSISWKSYVDDVFDGRRVGGTVATINDEVLNNRYHLNLEKYMTFTKLLLRVTVLINRYQTKHCYHTDDEVKDLLELCYTEGGIEREPMATHMIIELNAHYNNSIPVHSDDDDDVSSSAADINALTTHHGGAGGEAQDSKSAGADTTSVAAASSGGHAHDGDDTKRTGHALVVGDGEEVKVDDKQVATAVSSKKRDSCYKSIASDSNTTCKVEDETYNKYKEMLLACSTTKHSDELMRTDYLQPLPKGLARFDDDRNDRRPVQVVPIDIVVLFVCVWVAKHKDDMSENHRTALNNAIASMMIACGKGHWASLFDDQAAVRAEIVQFLDDSFAEMWPPGSNKELHKQVRRYMRCFLPQTSRMVPEAIEKRLCKRLWHLITSGADVHIVLVLMWYIQSKPDKIASCAIVVANMIVKISINTTPLAKWQNVDVKRDIRRLVDTQLMAKLHKEYEDHDWTHFYTCVNVVRYLKLGDLEGHKQYGGFYVLVTAVAVVEAVIVENKRLGVPLRGAAGDDDTSADGIVTRMQKRHRDDGEEEKLAVVVQEKEGKDEALAGNEEVLENNEGESGVLVANDDDNAATEEIAKRVRLEERASSSDADLAADWAALAAAGVACFDSTNEGAPEFTPPECVGANREYGRGPVLILELAKTRYPYLGVENYIIIGLKSSENLEHRKKDGTTLLTEFRRLFKQDVVNLVAPLRLHELVFKFITTWNSFKGGVFVGARGV